MFNPILGKVLDKVRLEIFYYILPWFYSLI